MVKVEVMGRLGVGAGGLLRKVWEAKALINIYVPIKAPK